MRLVLNSAIHELLYSTDDTEDSMTDKNMKTKDGVKYKGKGDCSRPRAIVIHLNGAVHSGVDEVYAMREITAQLCALIGPKLPRYMISDCVNCSIGHNSSHQHTSQLGSPAQGFLQFFTLICGRVPEKSFHTSHFCSRGF